MKLKELLLFIQWIVETHGRQLRGTGEPYTLHLFRVALDLLNSGFNFDVVVAAFCHDVLEDTDVTEEGLRIQLLASNMDEDWDERRVDRILEWVKELTEDPEQNKYERKEEVVKNVADFSYEALSIKYVDFIDNLNDQPESWGKIDPKHGVSYGAGYKLWVFQVWLASHKSKHFDENSVGRDDLMALSIRLQNTLFNLGDLEDSLHVFATDDHRGLVADFCRGLLSTEISPEALQDIIHNLANGKYVAVGSYRHPDVISEEAAAKKAARKAFKEVFEKRYGTLDKPGAEAIAFGIKAGESSNKDWGKFIEHVKTQVRAVELSLAARQED